MRYYRLIENLSGRDSLGYGMSPGRWNLHSTPLIYACSMTSLNFLEFLSIKGPAVTESAWKMIVFDVEGPLPELEVDYLPEDWKNRPYPRSTQEFGTAWAKSGISMALKIPSCRIPLGNYSLEHNLLINPLHPEFREKIHVREEWKVDFEVNR